MINPLVEVIVYTGVAAAVVPVMFSVFGVQYRFVDVLLAAAAGGLASLLPAVGGVASLVALVAILNYRCSAQLFPDIVVSVVAARLLMVPALLPFAH